MILRIVMVGLFCVLGPRLWRTRPFSAMLPWTLESEWGPGTTHTGFLEEAC